jgi:hypothetical protein
MKVDYSTFLCGAREIKFPVYIFALISMLNFWSCGSTDQVTSDAPDQELVVKTNLPPTGISLASSADTVSFWGDVDLTCTVEDPENDPITCEWSSYRLTDNSTLERYEIIYWLNHGEFSGTGQDVIWKPGKVVGPYLIFCNAKDEFGYEIIGKKMIRVVSTECVFVFTDKITYRSSDFDTNYWPHLNFYYTVTNRLDIQANLYGCGYITPGLQKKIADQWNQLIEPDGCEYAINGHDDSEPLEFAVAQVFPGEMVQDTSWTYLHWTTFDPGEYRLFFPYSLGSYLGDAFTDTLYSNEFEIVE